MKGHWVNAMSLPISGPNPNPRLRLPPPFLPANSPFGQCDPAPRSRESGRDWSSLCLPPLGLRSAFPWLTYALSFLLTEGTQNLGGWDKRTTEGGSLEWLISEHGEREREREREERRRCCLSVWLTPTSVFSVFYPHPNSIPFLPSPSHELFPVPGGWVAGTTWLLTLNVKGSTGNLQDEETSRTTAKGQ